jgi:hypothetical protein
MLTLQEGSELTYIKNKHFQRRNLQWDLKHCCSVRCLWRCGLCSCLMMEAARASKTSVYLPDYVASRLGTRLPSSNNYRVVIQLGCTITFHSTNAVGSTLVYLSYHHRISAGYRLFSLFSTFFYSKKRSNKRLTIGHKQNVTHSPITIIYIFRSM